MGKGSAWPSNVIAFPGMKAGAGPRGYGAVLVRHAGIIADMYGDDLAGFVLIGIGKDGCYSSGFRSPTEGLMSPMIFHSLMAEIMRRELVTHQEVKSVLRRQHLVEPEDEGA